MTGPGRVLNVFNLLVEDQLGCEIARKWQTWNMERQNWLSSVEEVRKFVYATDTTTTTNAKLPWKNKTTLPKLCQIRDNLHANYVSSEFPKKRWLAWDANDKDANEADKRDSILNYMSWVINQPEYQSIISELILDYIDYGNCFATVEWVDYRQELDDRTQVGYVGPAPRRISPLDIVFNPISSSFYKSPKIVRSLMTLGDVKEMLERMSSDTDKETYQALYDYLKNIRVNIRSESRGVISATGDDRIKDSFYQVDGFTSFQSYLESDFVEILTFYGDIFDYDKMEFLRNQVIVVADRHKVISKKTNPSWFGYPPIFHVGWRKRQDNLWAMGPLANLIGMQYRIDHIENMKADTRDLLRSPMLKIKGPNVDDFEWGPFGRIYMDTDSDVEAINIPFQVLQDQGEIQFYMQMMEEMAGAPKEAMGFRSPGEKTKYEVQRLENAASRIFQAKIRQFDNDFHEPLLNAMLELARRNLASVQSIPVFNDEFNIQTFAELTASDITGAGRLKPLAARHFAEKTEAIQNLTSFFGSAIGQDPGVRVHWSGYGIAKTMEDLLDVKDYELVQKDVRLSEEADSKKAAMSHEESTQMQAMTPSGLTPGDYDQQQG